MQPIDLAQRLIDDVVLQLGHWLPLLVSAIVILIIGGVMARVAAVLAQRGSQRLGLDRLAERGSVQEVLEGVGLTTKPSRMLSRLVFWMIMLAALAAAVDTLQVPAAAGLIERVLSLIPPLIGALLILVIGAVFAEIAARTAQAAAAAAGLAAHRGLGRMVRGVLLLFVATMAVEPLGYDLTVLSEAVVRLGLIAAAGIALAFGLGGRDVVRNILAGYYARENLREGECISVDHHVGTLIGIGTTSAQLRDGEQRVVLPNARLLAGAVIVKSADSDPISRDTDAAQSIVGAEGSDRAGTSR